MLRDFAPPFENEGTIGDVLSSTFRRDISFLFFKYWMSILWKRV